MEAITLHDPRYAITKQGAIRLQDHAYELPDDPETKRLKDALKADKERIGELQEGLYAWGHHSVLLIFQAMDAAGKDSCIRHVMSGVNPQGVRVWSFKAPSSLERSHDFLWRHYQAVPVRGHVGIHNRSHYEEVLITRVHPEYILAQDIPGIERVGDIDTSFWEQRYAAIRAWEEHLARNGTVIMKFFLHMSLEEQARRFLERLDDPAKQWKFNPVDLAERGHWNAYRQAYEAAIGATAAPHAPWYILPADTQWETRFLVGRLLRLQLEALNIHKPEPSAADLEAMQLARDQLLGGNHP